MAMKAIAMKVMRSLKLLTDIDGELDKISYRAVLQLGLFFFFKNGVRYNGFELQF